MKKEIHLNTIIKKVLLQLSITSFIISIGIMGLMETSSVINDYSNIMHSQVVMANSLIRSSILYYHDEWKKTAENAFFMDSTQLISYIRKTLILRDKSDIFYILDKDNTIIQISGKYQETFLKLDFTQMPQLNGSNNISKVYQSIITNKPVIALKYHINNNFTLIIERDLETIMPLMSHFENNPIFKDQMIFILTHEGIVVTHPDNSMVITRYNLGFDLKKLLNVNKENLTISSIDNQKYIAYQKNIDIPAGWEIYYMIPLVQIIIKIFTAIVIQIVYLSIIFLVIFVSINNIIYRYFSKPVLKIVNSINSYDPEINQQVINSNSLTRVLEFSEISNSINKMAEAIIQSKKDILENEEKYQTLIETTSEGFILLNSELNTINVNQSLCKMLGYSKTELLGKSISSFLDDTNKIILANKMSQITTSRHRSYEIALKKKNGVLFPAHVNATTLTDSNEESNGSFAFISDISEIIKSENTLKNLQNYLSNIIDSMPSILIGVDSSGKITQWNKSAEERTEITSKNAVGKKLPDVLPWMEIEMGKIAKSINIRKSVMDLKRARKTDNGIIYEVITIYPLVANGVEGAVIRIDDVTDKVKLEEMMIQSEKMLSVGGLAAGMAHEINNPLAGMIQSANVMNNRLTDIEMPANKLIADELSIDINNIKIFMEKRGIPEMIKAINNSGKRIVTIVDNMLSFARKSEDQISSHDITKLLDKTIELAATDYNLKKQYDFKQIIITKEYEENLPMIPCEGNQIQQVLLNILRNGAQALHLAKTENPQISIRVILEKTKNLITIEIGDNGPGMDEEIRKRVFEPFFTTKPVGEGTGLGLSVSYFIISENHGGEMSVESQPGNGTKFIISLPVEQLKKM